MEKPTNPTNGTCDNVTHVDAAYLNKLKASLTEARTQVEDQMRGQGASSDPTTTQWIEPVDSALRVSAGGMGAGAGSTFDAAAALKTALSNMGGSVHDQMAWLDKVLGDMINQITTTVKSFGTTEGVNQDSMHKLMSEFQATIGAIKKQSPPVVMGRS
jgi:superfamily II DNA helicase RecQ